jgi:surfeit locus 1 family protein
MSPAVRAGVVLVAALAGVVLTANLGAWQLRRAAQKIALQTLLEKRAALPELLTAELATSPEQAEAQHYRQVRLRGRWLASRNVFLDNRQMDGRVGFYLVTPLLLDGRDDAVLVQRGWVPRDLQDRVRLPTVATPAGPVEVVGRIAPPPARLFEFAATASGSIRQNLDVREFAVEAGVQLAPLSVQQTATAATAGDGLRRDWPPPAVNVQMHYGYAFQWFVLSALMAGLYVWFQLVRPRLRRDA